MENRIGDRVPHLADVAPSVLAAMGLDGVFPSGDVSARLTEMDALIAYLQGLGTVLRKTATKIASETSCVMKKMVTLFL